MIDFETLEVRYAPATAMLLAENAKAPLSASRAAVASAVVHFVATAVSIAEVVGPFEDTVISSAVCEIERLLPATLSLFMTLSVESMFGEAPPLDIP